ncbi:gamma-aminobutyric acid receptor subunit rho-1-like isoform X2 [Ciona intestinalis]
MFRLRSSVWFVYVIATFMTSQATEHESHSLRHKESEDGVKDDEHGTEVTRQIEAMFRVHSYELSIKPWNHGVPITVGISLMIESITDISEKHMDLTFTLCIHETWMDERLRFNVRPASSKLSSSVVLPSRLVQKIWVPDLYIVGSKSSFIHSTTVDNTVLRLFNDGRIIYNVRLTTTVACQMNLYNFPLDMENCSLTLQSLGYNCDELLLKWSNTNHQGSLFLDSKLVQNMPKFRLVNHYFHTLNVTNNEMGSFAGSSISQLQVNFIFKRYLLSVFFQSYFLAMSMVVLAGLGMWIDPKSVPARVAISVTSVLTLSTIITGLKTSLPKVSYLTAMDVYLWVSFLFVFSTVLEFCVFNYIMTKQRKKFRKVSSLLENKRRLSRNRRCRKPNTRGRELIDQQVVTSLTRDFGREEKTEGDHNTEERGLLCLQCQVSRGSDKIDVIFRLGYFVSFVGFNIIYWNYYITMACQVYNL